MRRTPTPRDTARTTRTALAGAALLGLALAAPLLTSAPATAGAQGATGAAGSAGSCASGELCLWQKPQYRGKRTVHELAGTDIESCVPLPVGAGAQALANRTGRPVTTYQSVECAETGEFETYPGGGTWLPESPYRVRAFKIWEN